MQRINENRYSSGNGPGVACPHSDPAPCRTRRVSRPLAALLALAMVQLTGAAGMAQASQFNPPKLDGYNLQDEHDADGDGDGVKETHIQQYFNAAGDSIFSMTTNGHLWAWSLDSQGEETGGPNNYVIRDSDCDGVFDEVYSLDDKYYLPDCVK